MGSIERRLAALEGRIAPDQEESTEARDKLVRTFMHRTLDAMAHIKRSPIDEERWRYEVGKLRGESAFTVAAHVAALRGMGHEDAGEACAIFEELIEERDLDGGTLWKLIDLFTTFMEQRRTLREEASEP